MANVKISALTALNTVDTTTQFAVISNTTGTNTTYRTSIANVTTAVLSSGNSNIRIGANSNIGFSAIGNSNVFIVTGTGGFVKATNGNIVIGDATATGSPGLSATGSMTLVANRSGTAKEWVFSTTGNLSGPSNANIGAANLTVNASGNLTLTSSGNVNLTPEANADVFITASGAGGGVQIQGGNNILSLQQGTPEFEVRADEFNVSVNSGTDGDVFFDVANGGDGNLLIETTAGTWTFDANGTLTLPPGGNINGDGTNPGPSLYGFDQVTTANANVGQTLKVVGNTNVSIINVGANIYAPNISETTTGTSPLLLWDDGGTGKVGYDSTIYYNHATETLNIGNLAFSDTAGNTGVSISSAEAGADGSIFFSVAAGGVLTLSADQRVKWTLLAYANIPNPAAGSIIYNNDVANAANGFYLCADGTGSASWDKIMAAKGNVVTLPGAASAPTAVAGGIYYNSTAKAFYMCANVTLGWQSVNLT